MNTTIIPETISMETVTFVTPQYMGELDAMDGLPFAPEMYFANHIDKCNYAVGWASVKGHSYLTDYFLLGSAVECIEDDYEFIRQGGA